MSRLSGLVLVLVLCFVVVALYLYVFASFCVVFVPIEIDALGRCFTAKSLFADWQWVWQRLSMSQQDLINDTYGRRFDPDWLQRMQFGLMLFALMFVCGVMMLEHYSKQARNKTVHGKFGSKNLHGEARWAERRDVKKAGLLDQSDGGVVIGGFDGKQLTDRSGLHVLCFAPTGTGKGVGIVTPTMLRWQGSVICLDIKRELYHQTAGYRASLGHRILPFDPSKEHSVRFNPLAEIRVGTEYAVADTQLVADVFINPGAIQGDNRYFADEAYTWVTAVFLHLLYKAKNEGLSTPTMRDAYLFMSLRDIDDADDSDDPNGEQLNEALNTLCQNMIDYDHCDDAINDLIIARARSMKNQSEKTRSSIISSAINPFAILFVDPLIIRNTSASDFTIDQLMNDDKPCSLYLLFPPAHISRLQTLIRLVIELFLAKSMTELKFIEGRAHSVNKHKMLLMMDEFTSIGRLAAYERALTYMRGYGIKSYVIIQNTGQLIENGGQKTYGKENAFLPNSNIITTYSSNHSETQELISKMCGTTTVVQEKVSISGKGFDKSRSVSLQEVSRRLLLPDDVGRLPITQDGQIGENIVFVAGNAPIRDNMYPYYKDKTLSARTKIPVPELVLIDNGQKLNTTYVHQPNKEIADEY